jgi:exodeoxyribonuclease V alpha subunit
MDYLKKKGAYRNSPEITRKEITANINTLGRKGDLVSPLKFQDNVILIKKYWELINDTAEYMKRHIDRLEYTNGYKRLNGTLVEKYLNDKTITYNEEQLMAIKSALNNKISVITGGPGTGKTQTIRGIIDAFYNRHLETKQKQRLTGKPNIQLCAPTGKAAQRIMDLTGKDAMTIHRLLGIRGGDVLLHELEEVQADLIIIDEASMIDSQLFFYLISAIKPYTHIVIIGDADQLPSIGRGFILRDLIGIGKGGLIGYTKLTRVYRQVDGNPITENAYSVLRHREGHRLNIRQGSGFKVIEKKKQEEIRDALLEEIDKHIQKNGNLDGLQVLTPQNKGDLGVEGLNKAIQERFNSLGEMQNLIEFDGITLRASDRVMQTVNNYELEVFNGEVGKIVDITEGPKVEVDYGYKTVEYLGEDIKELTLAYAITVHKSQGSEFDKVIMPLDRGHQLMLDKRLLYTAITRAKNDFVFIGGMETIRDAALKETEKGTGRNLLKKVLEL